MVQHKLRRDWWSSASTTLVLSRSSFPSSLAGLHRARFLAAKTFTRTYGGRKTLAKTFAPKVLSWLYSKVDHGSGMSAMAKTGLRVGNTEDTLK
jgi:hypothetical protein